MTINKILKCIALCLLSVILLTGILFLIALIWAILGDINEYVLGGLSGLVHTAIVLLLGYKFINKIGVSKGVYFLFVILIPAVIFNVVCAVYHYLNNSLSILDKGANLAYYLIFMSIAFSVSFVAVAITELVTTLLKRKKTA